MPAATADVGIAKLSLMAASGARKPLPVALAVKFDPVPTRADTRHRYVGEVRCPVAWNTNGTCHYDLRESPMLAHIDDCNAAYSPASQLDRGPVAPENSKANAPLEDGHAVVAEVRTETLVPPEEEACTSIV